MASAAHQEVDRKASQTRVAADAAIQRLVNLAEPLARQCEESGLTLYQPTPVREMTAFLTDASNLLPDAIGLVGTQQFLGRPAPAPRAVGMNVIARSERQPVLKLWVGISVVDGGPTLIVAAGAAICRYGGSHRSVWTTFREAMVDGPSEFAAMSEVVRALGENLPDTLAAWTEELRRTPPTDA